MKRKFDEIENDDDGDFDEEKMPIRAKDKYFCSELDLNDLKEILGDLLDESMERLFNDKIRSFLDKILFKIEKYKLSNNVRSASESTSKVSTKNNNSHGKQQEQQQHMTVYYNRLNEFKNAKKKEVEN